MPRAEDPFDNLELDEEFVRAAPVKEPSASARRLAEEQTHVAQLREARRARRRRRTARIVRRGGLLSIVAALVAGAWISYSDRRADEKPRPAPHSDVAMPDVDLTAGLPPPSVEEQPAPIGHPPPLPPRRGPYVFIASQRSGAAPVAYDPCRPVHVTINSRTAPPEGERLLSEALAQVSAATGITFVHDGMTDEAPSESRPPYQPDRYPGRWAPVLIAWADDRTDTRLRDDTSGYAGSVAISASPEADSVYVTGQVVLDGPQLDDILGEPGGIAAARAVMLHELGHLVGLQHVDDEDQIMNPIGNRSVIDYAAGDRTGLALLGQGACFPEV
ncbi:MAG TPA: matrixin family metalloprotease [Acidimicrobiales bacterium]|nr:matrixin family metalloprotease [Acidimicrobiales bacterium]